MNEEEFRTRFHGALGDPPPSDLRSRVEARLSAGPSRRRSSVLGPLAATLALLTIAGVVGWRLVYQRSNGPSTVKRSTVTTPVPTAAAVDPLNCRMPVVVVIEPGYPAKVVTAPGFVDTGSGQYSKDSGATIAGLPGGAFEGTNVKPPAPAAPIWYSQATKRWLPVGSTLVAPDGRSYLWTRLLPEGSNLVNFKRAELHRYDLTTSSDHLLWSYAAFINVHRWDASGILLDTEPPPPAGGTVIQWLIDPQTGSATQQPAATFSTGPTQLPGDVRNGGVSLGSFGTDAEGRTIYRLGSRQPGDQEWVFYESAPGQRVTIYKGRMGDATGFDPLQAMPGGRGMWFSDYGSRGLWYWDPATGLRKVVVKGLPLSLAGANAGVYVNPAGPCM